MASLTELGESLHMTMERAGLIPEIEEYNLDQDPGRVTYGHGFPITGVEKFLGYADSVMNIANFPSISITTNFMQTHAFCQGLREGGRDHVVLDGQVEDKYSKRAEKALNYFKSLFGITGSFRFFIQRDRKYKEAKGIGESASIAAAVARSLVSNVFGTDASKDAVFTSRIARLVSGSGTRSVAGGLSMWLSYPSIREKMSFGFKLADFRREIAIAAVPARSRVRTEDAHLAALKSIFYDRWAHGKFPSCQSIAMDRKLPEDIMRIAEEDFYRINAVLMSAGSIIQDSSSLEIIAKILEFRKRNDGLYFTTDTGPTIILMSGDRKIIEEFSDYSGIEVVMGEITSSTPSSIPENRYRTAIDYFSSIKD
ncbi:MAG: mevalonate pyrophosphate decarboxylase [Thermoplasmataceae archaeon]